MLIKANNDQIDVNVRVRNSKDSAYNTKVVLSFTPNIHYVKVEVRISRTCLSVLFYCVLYTFVLHCVFYFVLSARKGLHSE